MRTRPYLLSAMELLRFLVVVMLVNFVAGWNGYDESFYGEKSNYTLVNESCLFSLFPCSITITGNLILIGFYAIVLGFSAKIISDGAELLLDLGLPAAIIGGVVLPLLGAIPDAAMIVFSGIGGDRDEANQQISVGMGTLAGSTIMLLTIPWLGSLILGRVDIVNGVGMDETTSKFNIKSFINQGVTVFPDVTYSAVIMLITSLPYFIVQGADWHYGPATLPNCSTYSNKSCQPDYIRYSSLATLIFAILFLIAYLIFQVLYSVASKRKDEIRKEKLKAEMVQRNVIKSFYLTMKPSIQKKTEENVKTDEEKPLISSEAKKFAKVWRTHKAVNLEEEDTQKSESDQKEESEHEPKWKIFLKSSSFLIVGVALVTIFSDPMVDSLTSLTDKENKYSQSPSGHFGQYIPIPVFYLSFIVTPICSNASELVSSLIFASKRRRVNSSMTFSQLYGAATMNNTLCVAVFAALVFFRELDWQFSAEVTVILLVEYSVGIVAIVSGFGFKHTYILLLGLVVGCLYFFSILLIALLENFAHWK